MKFANNGKTVVCGVWANKMKNHFGVSIAHCSDKDKFSKKKGKQLAEARFNDGMFIVLPARKSVFGNDFKMREQLEIFLELNC